MHQFNNRVTKRENQLSKAAGQKASVFHPDCICFPSDQQPIFSFPAELEAALNIKCPLHGERLRPDLFILFRAGWRFADHQIPVTFAAIGSQFEATGTVYTTGCAPFGCGTDDALIGVTVNVDAAGTVISEPVVVGMYTNCL